MYKKIKVNLKENPYSIIIGRGSVYSLKTEIEKLKIYKNILVVIDANVQKYFGKEIKCIFDEIGDKINYYVLPSGEKSKSFNELHKIYSFLIEKNYGRDTLIAAVGGGVTGDLAGFAASTFMRGVDYIQIPTTLLSAVDSSVGGKTGMNFKETKNIIGAFYQPKLVIVDPVFLQKLPKEEVLSGAGEVIKYAFLSDEALYKYVSKNLSKIFDLDYDVIVAIIYKSLLIKSQVVIQDEKETGIRKILNLGHTFAHAYESELKFKIKHGEAVIAGVAASLYLSFRLGLIDEEKLNRLLALPLSAGVSKKIAGLNKNNLISIMLHDKKNRDGKIKFVLAKEEGCLLINVEADKKDVVYALEQTEKQIKKA
jgi:3-dehydroquinate synthase